MSECTNYGPSPLLPFYRHFIARETEYAVFEPSILHDFDRWWLWATCKQSGVPLAEWQSQDWLFRARERIYQRIIEHFEKMILEGFPLPTEPFADANGSRLSFRVSHDFGPCYIQKNALFSSAFS